MLITACGGADQLPSNATVKISPTVRTWDIQPVLDEETGQCVFFPDHYQDNVFVVSVQDSAGRAIGETDILVSLSHTENTASFYPMVELYDDKDGDYVPDPDELVSGEGDALFTTTTVEYTGEKILIVRSNVSCPYGAILQVVAQASSTEARIEVVEINE